MGAREPREDDAEYRAAIKAMVRRAAAAQGLPPVLSDTRVIARIAVLLDTSTLPEPERAGQALAQRHQPRRRMDPPDNWTEGEHLPSDAEAEVDDAGTR